MLNHIRETYNRGLKYRSWEGYNPFENSQVRIKKETRSQNDSKKINKFFHFFFIFNRCMSNALEM